MISLSNVDARFSGGRGLPPSHVHGLSFEWKSGLLVVLGSSHDGTSTLLSVLAGRIRARKGRVSIDGMPPDRAAASIAYVPLDITLPEGLRVEEMLALSARLRGDPPTPARERLSLLGLESLASRATESLSTAEARGVALALALTSRASVLLVEEPLAFVEATVPGRAVEVLRARAASGTCIVATTASVRDATRLADQLMILTRGLLAPLPPAVAHTGKDLAKFRVVASASSSNGIGELVAELSSETSIASVEMSAFEGRSGFEIVVTGADLVSVAETIGRVVAKHRIGVETIESSVVPIDAIRVALAPEALRVAPSNPPVEASPAT